MKQNITLCLDQELIVLLERTGNKSGTTNEILTQHFNISKPLLEIKSEKLQKTEDLMQEIHEIDDKILSISEVEEKLREEKDELIRQEKEKKHNDPKYWERIKVIMTDLFHKYDIEKGSFDVLLEEFMTLLKEKQIKNAEEFMNLKGIKKKEVKKNES